MQAAWTRAREAKQTLAVLSAREAQVLDLVSQGLTNKAVAARAGISEKTVEKHRSKIMRKLNVKSAAELMERVTHAKLLD